MALIRPAISEEKQRGSQKGPLWIPCLDVPGRKLGSMGYNSPTYKWVFRGHWPTDPNLLPKLLFRDIQVSSGYLHIDPFHQLPGTPVSHPNVVASAAATHPNRNRIFAPYSSCQGGGFQMRWHQVAFLPVRRRRWKCLVNQHNTPGALMTWG